MKSFSIFMVAGLLAIASNGIALDYDSAQSEMKKILRTHDSWISAAFIKKKGVHSIGTVPYRMKKWERESDKLIEISPTSLRQESDGSTELISKEFDLDEEIPTAAWIDVERSGVDFRKLSKSSFVLESPFFRVIVYPAKESPFKKQSIPQFQHMNAPFSLDFGQGTPPIEALTPLRHDLSKRRQVFIDANFPARFVPALKSALKKWNKVLRTQFYSYAGVLHEPPSRCVSEGWLCILWKGSAQLPWANISGFSSVAYDPISGLIHGGYIGIKNSNTKQTLPAAQPQTVELIKNGDLNTVAKLLLKREQFEKIAHPFPEKVIESIFLHELGHDNALRHYFMGSQRQEQGQHSDTVMDYMPFPLFHTMQELGSRDRTKVENIYFGGQSVLETACSDKEVLTGPMCKAGDIGSTEDWLMRLADVGNQGVLTEFQFLGGHSLFFSFPEPLFMHLSRFVISESFKEHATAKANRISEKVKTYLCEPSRRKRIQDYLLEHPLKFDTQCPGENNPRWD